MTVVIGIEEGDRVYLGSDSMASSGTSKTVLKRPKILAFDEFLISGSGLLRVIQAAHAVRGFRAQKDREDDYFYVTHIFANALREHLKQWGALSNGSDVQSTRNNWLLAYRGALYHMDNYFSVTQAEEGYDAIGSGADVAKGVLWAFQDLPAVERMMMAFQAAARFDLHVSPPFYLYEKYVDRFYVYRGTCVEDLERVSELEVIPWGFERPPDVLEVEGDKGDGKA